MSEGVVVGLEQQSDGCTVCNDAQRGNTNSNRVPIQVGQKLDGYIASETTRSSDSFAKASNNDGPVENSECTLRRGRPSEKYS